MKQSKRVDIKYLLQSKGASDDVIKTILDHDYIFEYIIENIVDEAVNAVEDYIEDVRLNKLATEELEDYRLDLHKDIGITKRSIKDIKDEYIESWQWLLAYHAGI